MRRLKTRRLDLRRLSEGRLIFRGAIRWKAL